MNGINIQFYDVKSKKKIGVPLDKVKKIKYSKKTSKGLRITWAVRAEYNGLKLTKFVSKDDWEKLDAPETKK